MAVLRHRIRRAALTAALLLGPALLSGCLDLFKPATPAPPTATGGVLVPTNYGTPDKTLATMAAAMANKNATNGNGADAWIGAFANPATDNLTPVFVFDPGVLVDLGITDPAWNLTLERNFYVKLPLLDTHAYYLTWAPWAPCGNDEDLPDGTAIRPRTYRLYTVDGSGNTLGTMALGIAKLTFKQVGTRWVITQWVDLADPAADPSDNNQVCFSRRRLSLQ